MQLLFPKEKEIMDIFWAKKEPCIISEILKADPTLSRNTVAKNLTVLEKKGYLRVDSIRKTATRTGRAYVPTITPDYYDRQVKITNLVANSQSLSQAALTIVSTLLDSGDMDDECLATLETMIADYKNK